MLYKYLEKWLAEDFYVEIQAILHNQLLSDFTKTKIIAENFGPKLDYVKADLLIKQFKRRNNGQEKRKIFN